MGALKKSCPSCGNGMIGRSRAVYCSPACKQRAHRSRKGAGVTVAADSTVPRVGQLGGHSVDAVALLQAMDAELAENAKKLGRPLKWSAAERAILELAADTIDRRGELQSLYEATADAKLQLKIACELRLIEAALARLLAKIKTEMPAPQSNVSRKAAHAARVRWDSATD
jgi:hypothetical protein